MVCQELGNESKVAESRFLAAILFKNTINSNDEGIKDVWLNYDAETKKTIKNIVVATLASNNKKVRKGAAQAVSAIASVEIPRREWPEIIDVLSTNALGQNIDFKLASLETLGYICEELEISHLEIVEIDLVLSALVSNIISTVENDDIKFSAVRALLQTLRFCQKNFKTDNERQSLMDHIIAACGYKSTEVRMKAMQCLVEIVREFYDYIQPHLDQLGAASFNAIAKDEEEVALQGIELWCSICDEELNRKKYNDPSRPAKEYINYCYLGLVKVMLENISRKEEFDDSDWNVSVASGCCLSLIATCVGEPMTGQVISFTGLNLESENWKLRDAAILAFASILEGPPRPIMNNFITTALPSIIKMLSDPKPNVRETTAWALSRIAELNHEPLLEVNMTAMLIQKLLEALKDFPKIANQACFCFHNMGESLAVVEGQNSNVLSPYVTTILTHLWDTAFREDGFSDGVTLTHGAFAAMTNLFQYAAPDTLTHLGQFMNKLVIGLEETLSPQFKFAAHSEDYQAYFTSAMQPLLTKMGEKLNKSQTDTIMNLITKTFQIRKLVYDEGILAISGVATALGTNFKEYMNGFGPFLAYGLKQTEDISLCRVSVGCIGDLSRALGFDMAPYLPDIVPILMEILRNPDLDRNIKLYILTVLGDLAIATNKQFLPYVPDVMVMLQTACQLSLSKPEDDVIYIYIYIY